MLKWIHSKEGEKEREESRMHIFFVCKYIHGNGEGINKGPAKRK